MIYIDTYEQEIQVITYDTGDVIVTTVDPSASNTAIQFQDEGVNLGTTGTVNTVDFTGAGVTASRSGDKITVAISGGGSSTPSINVEGGTERKISAMTALTAANADNLDLLTLVDVSDTTDAATGTNKSILTSEAKKLFAPTQFLSGSALDRYIPFNVKRNQNSPGTTAQTINRFLSFPWYCDSVITIDRLAAEVTTGSTGNFQLGVYPTASNGSPVGLAPIITTGNIAVSGTGVKTATVSYTFYPGLYWIGFWSDTGNTFRSYALVAGYQFVQGFPSSAFSAASNMHFSTESGIPSTHPALSISNAGIPVICFRIA